MATHYRKLLNESIEDSITDFCSPYCEPEKNQLGLCPLTCITFCYPICNRPFLAAIPPPPQDNITTTTLDDHREDEHYKSSQILALSLSILVIALVFLLFYAICKFCNAWCNSTREESELQRNQEGSRREEFLDQDLEPDRVYHPVWYITCAGLQPSVISSINICKYKKGDGLVEGTECSVCLNEFQEDETLRLLPKCNHAFHIPCIDTWLTSHTNCPMCRADIVLNPVLVSPSSPEQNLDNSRALEETQEPGSANQGEFEMEREYEFCESRVEHEGEGKSQIQSAVNSNQDSKEESENSDSRELEGFQPLRRSVSLVPSSASLTSAETANADPAQSDKELNKVNESREGVFANRVTAKSLSRSSRTRSADRSEQVLSRHSRSRN